jgi:hypothetical protein
MFTTLVIVFNLVSLAGIMIGLLLRSPGVRDIIDRSYVYASDIAVGKLPADITDAIPLAIRKAVILGKNNKISPKKLLMISLVSTVLFSMSFICDPSINLEHSHAARIFGGGTLGLWGAVGLVNAMAWPGHIIFDAMMCSVLLRISRRQRPAFFQFIILFGALSLVSLIPLVFIFAMSVPIASTGNLSSTFVLWLTPLVFNGPTVLWLKVLGTWTRGYMSSGVDALLILSSLASSTPLLLEMISRLLIGSKRVMRIVAGLSLKISETNADRLFSTSLVAFAIGNGLCQVFGISIKLE